MQQPDQEKLNAFLGRMVGDLGAAASGALVPLGDRLGLYKAMRDGDGALHRSWFFDPKTVTVSADGGKVRLGSTVHSFHDREVAAHTAWAAPGVTGVENDIAVI